MIENCVTWLRVIAELFGAAVIAGGVTISIVGFILALVARKPLAFTDVRLTLGRYLALGLEFQLAAEDHRCLRLIGPLAIQ